ncbi:MAG: Lipoyl synthase 2 [Candidatus Anoxychlamydiales bacterium]|nr:Lipoyl synthase 2 [Candidatus Anoxychlamydiales bacterium]
MNFPEFLRKKLTIGPLNKTIETIKKNKIHTVCVEANCPNRFECFSKKTATFLALGKECTRACSFCDIDFSKKPKMPDPNEPFNIANSAKILNLKHIVITMVARDDLPDKGANHLCKIIREVKKINPNSTIETLTSDFSCKFDLIDLILNEKIDIFNYNIETVERISPKIRHKATYTNSLKILGYAKNSKKVKFVKSGLMVGVGETKKEVFQTIKDLKEIGVDIITIGQYLSPNNKKYPIKSFVTPKEFQEYKDFAKKIGVHNIYADPYVRSSYNAKTILNKALFK